MPENDLDYEELTKELINNFNTLADAVQLLSDRNTILQHKLQYAHTEVSLYYGHIFVLPYFIMMRNFSSRSRATIVATTDNNHVS